ncbi:hypothetical protein [Labrenzia sp. 011]|uniref:hypothetical protein n=1 Tax=Labrenzia sp. 011 TaxID=2171494 RepID=UPI001401F4B6|nr:hypothetical protein [Labrenzia sp. 011]
MVPRPEAPGKKPKSGSTPQEKREHIEDLLDEALDETFPASDPPAMLEPDSNPKPD